MSHGAAQQNNDTVSSSGTSELEKKIIDSIAGKLSGIYNVGNGRPLHNNTDRPPGARRLQAKVEVNLEIPPTCVGGILGKHGSIVKQMCQRSGGARITFADKNIKNEGGSGGRKLTITGDMDQTFKAFNLVSERVKLLENEGTESQSNNVQLSQFP